MGKKQHSEHSFEYKSNYVVLRSFSDFYECILNVNGQHSTLKI